MAMTQANANMVLGGRGNQRQMTFGIPAGPTGDDPGIIVFESSSSAAAHSQVFLWADSTNVLRSSATLPTNEDSDGTVLAGTAATTSSRALDNLTVTAINASLIPGTDSTIDAGSSAAYFANVYTDKIYFYSTAYITGTSGVMTTTGNVVLGANGTASDVTFYGDTSNVYMWWDGNGNTNGALIFEGATATSSIQFVQSNVTYTVVCASDILTIDATDHANAAITVGNDTTTNGIDLIWYTASAGKSLKIDAGTDAVILDDTTLIFQTTSTHAMHMVAAANALLIDGQSANDSVKVGATTATDFLLGGNGHSSFSDKTVFFDASAITLGLLDNCILGFGNTAASPDISIKWDATDLLVDGRAADTAIKIGATNNQDVFIYAATATNYVQFNTDDTANAVLFAGFNATFADATIINFGTDKDLYVALNNTGAKLEWKQTAAGTGVMTYGADGKGIDQTWFVETASSYIKLDQANDRLLAYIAKIDIGNATVTYDFALSTNSLVLSCTDNAGAKLILGTTGTNGLDIDIVGAAANQTIGWNAATGVLTFGSAVFTTFTTSANGRSLALPSKSDTGDPGTTGTTEGCVVWNTTDKTISVFTGAGWVSTSSLS